MQAAILSGVGRYTLGPAKDPEPGPGEVVIQVLGCGICGSNLPPWMGEVPQELPLPPGAPGHEAFGIVLDRGPQVDRVEVGQLVTGLTYRSFAELDVAAANTLAPIPEALAACPVLGEPLACAVNVSSRARLNPEDMVVVVGAGFLGLLTLQLVRRAEPSRVIAISRRAEARELATRLGADIALGPEEAESAVASMSGGRMADIVIEATGYQRPLDLAGKLVRVRGRLVVAGYHQSGRRSVDLQLWNWKGVDVINAHEREPYMYYAGMLEGIRLLEAGALSIAPLLTHRFSLQSINEAFQTAAEMPRGFVKAIVSPRVD